MEHALRFGGDGFEAHLVRVDHNEQRRRCVHLAVSQQTRADVRDVVVLDGACVVFAVVEVDSRNGDVADSRSRTAGRRGSDSVGGSGLLDLAGIRQLDVRVSKEALGDGVEVVFVLPCTGILVNYALNLGERYM